MKITGQVVGNIRSVKDMLGNWVDEKCSALSGHDFYESQVGRFGNKCLEFKGNGEIDITIPPIWGGGMMAWWICPKIINKFGIWCTYNNYIFLSDMPVGRIYSFHTTGWNDFNGTIAANTWHHMCVSYDYGGTVYVYLDGAVLGTCAKWNNGNTVIRIGCGMDNAVPFTGLIDDFIVIKNQTITSNYDIPTDYLVNVNVGYAALLHNSIISGYK